MLSLGVAMAMILSIQSEIYGCVLEKDTVLLRPNQTQTTWMIGFNDCHRFGH